MASSVTASASVYGTPMHSGAGQLRVFDGALRRSHRLLSGRPITGVRPSETHR